MTDKVGPGHQLSAEALQVRQRSFRECHQSSPTPVVIAYGLHTPDNIGGVLRQSEAAGCRRVLLVECNITDLSNKVSRIARSSDKYLDIQILQRAELLAMLDHLPPLIAVEITSQSRDLYQSKLPVECCFLVGGERQGIDDELLGYCESALHIPMFGVNSSMNVSHALTLALFEWRRQR